MRKKSLQGTNQGDVLLDTLPAISYTKCAIDTNQEAMKERANASCVL
jgi:hypothetical protein